VRISGHVPWRNKQEDAPVNRYQIMSPDGALGKMLLAGRAECQLLGLRLGGGPWDGDFARAVRLLVPRYTMVSVRRLKVLYELGAELGRGGPAGAVVECGVWNGGSSAMVAAGLGRAGGAARPFWLFDSFAGLPDPTEDDGERVRAAHFPGWCTGAEGRVLEAHRLVGHGLRPAAIVPGWFDDTLERNRAAVGPIALLHIDADWYDSVLAVLRAFYAQVVAGGTVVIDDYGAWAGCRKAVHDHFGEGGLRGLGLRPIDGNGVYFKKP